MGESPEASDEEDDANGRGGRAGAGGSIDDDWDMFDDDARLGVGDRRGASHKGGAAGGKGSKARAADSTKQGLLAGGGRLGGIDAEFD